MKSTTYVVNYVLFEVAKKFEKYLGIVPDEPQNGSNEDSPAQEPSDASFEDQTGGKSQILFKNKPQPQTRLGFHKEQSFDSNLP